MDILENDPRLDSEVFNALMDTGIPANMTGYHYLKELIPLAVVNPKATLNACKNLYTPLADVADKTPGSVQAAIRNAIKVGWDRADKETLTLYFGYTVNSASPLPATSAYIATVAERIRIRLGTQETETPFNFEDELVDEVITRLLYNLNLIDYNEGYLYLKYAIKVALQRNMAAGQLVPAIYQIVADGYLVTASHVKYVLGRCVDIILDAQNLYALQVLFGSAISLTPQKPTISDLLSAAVEGVKRELQAEPTVN